MRDNINKTMKNITFKVISLEDVIKVEDPTSTREQNYIAMLKDIALRTKDLSNFLHIDVDEDGMFKETWHIFSMSLRHDIAAYSCRRYYAAKLEQQLFSNSFMYEPKTRCFHFPSGVRNRK